MEEGREIRLYNIKTFPWNEGMTIARYISMCAYPCSFFIIHYWIMYNIITKHSQMKEGSYCRHLMRVNNHIVIY